jgi:hypothetical protein
MDKVQKPSDSEYCTLRQNPIGLNVAQEKNRNSARFPSSCLLFVMELVTNKGTARGGDPRRMHVPSNRWGRGAARKKEGHILNITEIRIQNANTVADSL